MAFMQGDPLPDITKTTTTESEAPSFYTDYLEDLASAGTPYLSKTGKELVAGYDPLQTTGFEGIEDAAGAYEDLFGKAETAAGGFGGIGATDISAFYNPYETNVLDEMERLSNLNVQRNLLPQLKAGFVGSGGLGGQRYAGALGQSLADVQSNLTGQQSQLMYKGYQDAIANAFKQAQEERAGAESQADLAQLAQELGLRDMGALIESGALRQAYEQTILDAPLKTAANVQALLRGYEIPKDQIETYVGPGETNQYQQSDLTNVLGILSLIGAATGNVSGIQPGAVGSTQLGGAGLAKLYNEAKDFFKDTNIFNSSVYGTGIDEGVYDARIDTPI
jgi:hypothetical protein